MGRQFARLLFLVFFYRVWLSRRATFAGAVRRKFAATFTTWEDKVSHVRRFLCSDCLKLADTLLSVRDARAKRFYPTAGWPGDLQTRRRGRRP